MIAETITAINAALFAYPGPLHSIKNAEGEPLDSRVLGLVRPAFSSHDKHLTLFVPATGQPVTDDDALGWLSMHVTAGIPVDNDSTAQYGYFQEPVFRFQMQLVLLSRDPAAIGRALMTLPAVPNVRLFGRIEDNVLEVMKRSLGYPATRLTEIDPALWGWSIPYEIVGISADDIRVFYAELNPLSDRYAPNF